MTQFQKSDPTQAAALKEAMAKAADQIKGLKTFEIKGDPVETLVKGTDDCVTIQVRLTGADRNYSQSSLNYLKGEAEGHGNAATDAIKKVWEKYSHKAGTEVLIPWISTRAYKAILENAGVHEDKIPASTTPAKLVDLDLLLELDPKRQEAENLLLNNADQLIRQVVDTAETTAAMAMSNPQGLFRLKSLKQGHTVKEEVEEVKDKDGKVIATKTTQRTDVTIQDKKDAVDYIERATLVNQAALDLFDMIAAAIEKAGGRDKIKAVLDKYTETYALYKGDVQASEEAEAKAEKAAKREDKKAEKDEALKASIVKSFMAGVPMEYITMLTKVSQTKAEEILTAAGYDPNKPYSEQAKAE